MATQRTAGTHAVSTRANAPEAACHQETGGRTTTHRTELECAVAAWDCQSHGFLGSPATVAANLAGLPDEVVRRRVYMLMIQGDARAEARVFERFAVEDRDATVARWSDSHLGGLVTQVTEVLVTNRGVHCPGEQVKAVLADGEREFSVEGPAPAPATAKEAFLPAMEAYKDDRFVQATVMILC
jgi:hypothetical protein